MSAEAPRQLQCLLAAPERRLEPPRPQSQSASA